MRSEAADRFSSAILAEPERPQAFLGFASAAYLVGDLAVPHAAANRALTPRAMEISVR